jgi:surfeit locus 1 family protein
MASGCEEDVRRAASGRLGDRNDGLLVPATLSRHRLRYALGLLFSRRWWLVTLAVVLICAGLARLGVWQLDRLAERRARSAELAGRLSAPALTLTPAGLVEGGGAVLDGGDGTLAYRRVVARGRFDYAQEVALVNQVRDGQLGLHLITPLVLDGSERAVAVDRGWIPAVDQSPASWAGYHAPAGPDGMVEISAWLRPAPPADGRRVAPGPAGPAGASARAVMPARLVPDLDPAHLSAQLNRPLLPLVLVQVADEGAAPVSPPYRQSPNPDLGDGAHLIAAAQWFAFGGIGLIGYVVYLGRLMPPPGPVGPVGPVGPTGPTLRRGPRQPVQSGPTDKERNGERNEDRGRNGRNDGNGGRDGRGERVAGRRGLERQPGGAAQGGPGHAGADRRS